MFGRNEMLCVSVIFYVIGRSFLPIRWLYLHKAGTVVEASCNSISVFAVGAVLYQVGYTLVILILEIIVADSTSLRSRVYVVSDHSLFASYKLTFTSFFSYIPPFCYLIIPWFSPEISNAVLSHSTWRWGIGMWAILYAVCTLPLFVALYWVSRKAKQAGRLKNLKTPYQQYGGWALVKVLFWQLDVIGLVLLTSVLGLTLTPLTLAGGKVPQAHWAEARIIIPLVVGTLSIPVFIWWQTKAPFPLIPFHVSHKAVVYTRGLALANLLQLLRDRAVFSALAIALLLNFSTSLIK